MYVFIRSSAQLYVQLSILYRDPCIIFNEKCNLIILGGFKGEKGRGLTFLTVTLKKSPVAGVDEGTRSGVMPINKPWVNLI